MNSFVVTYNEHLAIDNAEDFQNCKFPTLFDAVCYAVRWMFIYSPVREPQNEDEATLLYNEMFRQGYSITNDGNNIVQIGRIH